MGRGMQEGVRAAPFRPGVRGARGRGAPSGTGCVRRKIRWSRETSGSQEAERLGDTHASTLGRDPKPTRRLSVLSMDAEEGRVSKVGEAVSEGRADKSERLVCTRAAGTLPISKGCSLEFTTNTRTSPSVLRLHLPRASRRSSNRRRRLPIPRTTALPLSTLGLANLQV